jgi:hypothetical protein
MVVVLAVGGCAAPGYDPSRVQSELVRAGTTPQQARCVTDRLPLTFDVTQLGSHSAPSASAPPTTAGQKTPNKSEYEKTRDILKQCGVTLPLSPLPH